MGADDEQITTALDALIDGYASAMVRVEQEFCCSGAESTALYAEVNTVVEAAEAEVATLRADLAAVRTDLSVARADADGWKKAADTYAEALSLACHEGWSDGDAAMLRYKREAEGDASPTCTPVVSSAPAAPVGWVAWPLTLTSSR